MMLFVDARLIRKRDVSGVVMRFDEDDVSGIKCAIRMGADNDRIVGAMICAAQEEDGRGWIRVVSDKKLTDKEVKRIVLGKKVDVFEAVKTLILDKVQRVREGLTNEKN